MKNIAIFIYSLLIISFGRTFALQANQKKTETKLFCENIYKFTKGIGYIYAAQQTNKVIFPNPYAIMEDKTLYNTKNTIFIADNKRAIPIIIDNHGVMLDINKFDLFNKDLSLCRKAPINTDRKKLINRTKISLTADILFINHAGKHRINKLKLGMQELFDTVKKITGSIVAIFIPRIDRIIIITDKTCIPSLSIQTMNNKNKQLQLIKINPSEPYNPYEIIAEHNYYGFAINKLERMRAKEISINNCSYKLRFTLDKFDQ